MSAPKQAAERVVNRIVDGTQTFWHDLFRSDTTKMIKNIFSREDQSGRGNQQAEDLKPIDHCHLFHSHDSNGRPQTTCVSVGGHYHKITTHDAKGNPLLDGAGRPRVECSKPFRKKKVRRGKKMVTIEEEVKWGMEDGSTIADNHTHIFSYEKSKELSPDKMEQLKRQNARGILSAFEGAPQLKDNTPAAMTEKDGVTIS